MTSAPSSALATARIPPSATLRTSGSGTTNSTAMLTITVRPDTNTARPAGSSARVTASLAPAPPAISSRKRCTVSSA